MRYGLQIDAPDPLSTDPDSRARGRYIHRVLDGYYRSLVSEHGRAVHPAGEPGAREERLLTVALGQITEVFGSHEGSAFHAEWLRRVLAGLGDPDRNEHHGSPGERGLFARFLEHESTVLSGTTARPRWTEASVGRPSDDGAVLQDDPAEVETPAGPVRLHGLIDRVDVVPETQPTQLVVRDYKTGAVPSETDTLLGLRFQLPLYALLAEAALEDVEVVGGAYYQVRPPGQVSSRRGQLTSGEMVEWKDAEGVQTPLLRDRRPAIETHKAFRRFLETTMPERLGEVAGGIAAGRFHPTVLDPRDAGCSYCDYRHVCDVRHHLRHELIDSIQGDTAATYIPPVAEGRDVGSVLEVE
jgi:ATP-dependent helicase/nuclease subunit B